MTAASMRGYALRWTDTSFPGWLEVEFEDARGRLHRVVDKAPVLTSDPIAPSATFPFQLPLQVTLGDGNDVVVTVTLAHGVATITGQTTLEVPRHAVELATD